MESPFKAENSMPTVVGCHCGVGAVTNSVPAKLVEQAVPWIATYAGV